MNYEKMDEKTTPAQRGREAALRLTDQDSFRKYDNVVSIKDTDGIIYEIKKIKGDKVVVWIPRKPESEITVKKGDLYDPSIAQKLAKRISGEKD